MAKEKSTFETGSYAKITDETSPYYEKVGCLAGPGPIGPAPAPGMTGRTWYVGFDGITGQFIFDEAQMEPASAPPAPAPLKKEPVKHEPAKHEAKH